MSKTPLFDPAIGFDITFNQFGGKWDFNQEDQEHKEFHHSFLTYCESIPKAILSATESIYADMKLTNTLPKIHSGIINGQSLNCYAARSQDQYYIGMTGMIPIALLEISAFFFSEESFYPDIGDTSDAPVVQLDGRETVPFFQIAENRFVPLSSKSIGDVESEHLLRSICTLRGNATAYDHSTGIRLSAKQYLLQFDTLIDMLLPVCVIRREHCRYLASIMVHFFWYHELAHVTQGHLRHLQIRNSLESIRLGEFPDLSFSSIHDGSIRIEDIQTLSMELEADVEATLMTIGSIMIDLDIESDDFPYVDKYKRVELFVFMLVSVFGAFSFRYNRFGLKETKSHPPAKIRLINILRYLITFSGKDKKIEKSIINGIDRAKGLGKYGKFSYLNVSANLTDEDIEILQVIDKNRLTLPNAYDSYNYANLRVLIDKWLREMEIHEILS